MSLPIDNFQTQILKSISSNPVCVITGKTGCGKSTRVPQMILDNLIPKSVKSNCFHKVIVCTPTRISAFSLAKYVAQQRREVVGKDVGYAIGGERLANFFRTRIEYQTIGVLKEMLLHKMLLKIFGLIGKEKKFEPEKSMIYVIIDEIHERGVDQDTSLFLLRRYLRKKAVPMKLILMSATISPETFLEYFGEFGEVPHIAVPTRLFGVKKYYLEEVFQVKMHRRFLYVMEHFQMAEQGDMDMHEMIKRLYEVGASLIADLHDIESEEKTILVFLPGLSEILAFEKMLCEFIPKVLNVRRKEVKIYILHSCINIKEQKKVFERTQRNVRKIILSTNISESSITVPTVSYVIDFCTFKEMNLNVKNGAEELLLKWASRESMKQRKGRAGRTKEGKCFRLVPKAYYKKMKKHITPEILRVSLSHLILKLIQMKIGSVGSVLQQFISPPSNESIQKALSDLQEMNGLDDRFKVTSFGKFITNLPINLNCCALVWYGYIFGMLDECVILSGVLEVDGIMNDSFHQPLKHVKDRFYFSQGSNSDVITSFNAFLHFRKEEWDGNIRRGNRNQNRNRNRNRNSHSFRSFCMANGISERRLKEAQLKISLVYDKLNIKPIENPHRLSCNQQSLTFLKVLLTAAYMKNFVMNYKANRRQIPGMFQKSLTAAVKVNPEVNPNAQSMKNFLENFGGGFGRVKKIHRDMEYYEDSKYFFVEFHPPRNPGEIPGVTCLTKFSGKDLQKRTRFSKNNRFSEIPYSRAFGEVELSFVPLFYSKKSKISRFSVLTPYTHSTSYTPNFDCRFVFTSQHLFSRKKIFVSMNTLVPEQYDPEGFMHLIFLVFAKKVSKVLEFGKDGKGREKFLQVIQNRSVYYFKPRLNRNIITGINKLRNLLHDCDLAKVQNMNRKAPYNDLVHLFELTDNYIQDCKKPDKKKRPDNSVLDYLSFVRSQLVKKNVFLRRVCKGIFQYAQFSKKSKYLILACLLDIHIDKSSFFLEQIKRIEKEKCYISFFIDPSDNIKMSVFQSRESISKLLKAAQKFKLNQMKYEMKKLLEKIQFRYGHFVRFEYIKEKLLIIKHVDATRDLYDYEFASDELVQMEPGGSYGGAYGDEYGGEYGGGSMTGEYVKIKTNSKH